MYKYKIYMSRRQNQLLMLRNRFLGALSLHSVLFESPQNNATMKQNWLHGFRSLKCWECIEGPSVFAFGTMLRSYLSTFLDSFDGSQRL